MDRVDPCRCRTRLAYCVAGETNSTLEVFVDFSLLGFHGLLEVFNVHPAFVHFPIALLPASFLFYFTGRIFQSDRFYFAGRACLCVGFLSVIITVVTGLRAQDSFPHNDIIHHMMQTHRTIGWFILAITFVLSVWSFWQSSHRPNGFWAFLVFLGFSTYLVLQNGDLGSRMVYVHGAAVKPAAGLMNHDTAVEGRPEQPTVGKETKRGHTHDHTAHDHAH